MKIKHHDSFIFLKFVESILDTFQKSMQIRLGEVTNQLSQQSAFAYQLNSVRFKPTNKFLWEVAESGSSSKSQNFQIWSPQSEYLQVFSWNLLYFPFYALTSKWDCFVRRLSGLKGYVLWLTIFFWNISSFQPQW